MLNIIHQKNLTENFNPACTVQYKKGSPSTAVKLLPCDHEVMDSSPRNSLLQKCRERLRTYDPKWSDPVQAGAICTRLPLCTVQYKEMKNY
jgi:hypothetical protein